MCVCVVLRGTDIIIYETISRFTAIKIADKWLNNSEPFSSVCVCVRAICVCACVSVCECVCKCACACVCVWWGGGGGGGHRACVRVCVRVCVDCEREREWREEKQNNTVVCKKKKKKKGSRRGCLVVVWSEIIDSRLVCVFNRHVGVVCSN